MKYSCVTDYEAVYAKNYFAHAQGSTSFEKQKFGKKLVEVVGEFTSSRDFLDIGGGNGTLSKALSELGANCFTLDAQDRDGDDYRRIDLSLFNKNETSKILRIVESRLNDDYVATCFDVAEHIDPEHISSFLLNLNDLTQQYLVISISTRPSSMGNRYHSTILPTSTWTGLLEAAGFTVDTLDSLDKLKSANLFSEANESLWAVSHWQRMNVFREKPSHQVYLKCKKTRSIQETDSFTSLVRKTLDIDYRWQKRSAADAFPHLTYHVTFWQDWSFLRSIMDVWPRDRLHVILRTSTLIEPLWFVARNFLTRVNVPFSEYASVAEGRRLVRQKIGEKQGLFVTSSEGPPHPLHLASARVTIEARSANAMTLCVQHGLTTPKPSLTGAEIFWTWGTEFMQSHALADDAAASIDIGGSPKLLDARFEQVEDAFSNRFGSWTRAFEKRVLIGLSLHWKALNQKNDLTRDWVDSLCRQHPDMLFVIRPHPDDTAVLNWRLDHSNLVILDDLTLTCMDWPVARLTKSVDLVLSPPSTLLLDAFAAETPVAVYGVETYTGPVSRALDWIIGAAHQVTGEITPNLFRPNVVPEGITCTQESLAFFERIRRLPIHASGKSSTIEKPERILDWANNIPLNELASNQQSTSNSFKQFASMLSLGDDRVAKLNQAALPQEQEELLETNEMRKMGAEHEVLLREYDSLRKDLEHAHRYPWKYFRAALSKRRNKLRM